MDEQIKPEDSPDLEINIKCAHSTQKHVTSIPKLHGIHLWLSLTVKEFKMKLSVESNYWVTTADEHNKERMKKYLLSAIATNLSTHCYMSLAEIKSSTALIVNLDA